MIAPVVTYLTAWHLMAFGKRAKEPRGPAEIIYLAEYRWRKQQRLENGYASHG